MKGQDLSSFALKDPFIRKYFKGVYAKDELQVLTASSSKPQLIIVNTDRLDQPGKHWICLWLSQQQNEQFDPLGKPPLPEMRQVLGDRYNYNTQRVQHPSSESCGQFCLYYAYYKSRGYSMKDILHKFDPLQLVFNDSKVNYFYQLTS